MQVIGAGLPRTGTLSQKAALELLGLGPCFHWVDLLADLDQVSVWDRALDGDAAWDRIFAGFNSTVDWPGGHFYRELADAYPEAKVLLSTRDATAWEKSFRETIWSMCFGESLIRLLSSARAQIDPRWERYLALELQGRRYDIGLKYGLLTEQLALALDGGDRDEVLSNLVEMLALKGDDTPAV